MLLVGVTLIPGALGALGGVYLLAAVVLGAGFLRGALILRREATSARAWRLFKFSNVYLALLYAAMVLDRLLALGGVHLL